MNTSVIVFGEGSASVFLISQLIKKGESVVWVSGSGAKLHPVMPYVKSERALGTLLDCQNSLNSQTATHPLEKGTFHRVFRNKGFKLPSWKRTSSLQAQKEVFEELVWAPEQAFLGVEEYRVSGLAPMEIEQALRDQLENHASVTRVQNVPILELEVFEQGGKVQFANKLVVEFKQFYFCDALSELSSIPKLGPVFKHQLSGAKLSSRVSALQVIFHHSTPLKVSSDTGFVIPMNRDAGETFDRDVLGYFVSPTRSIWTVFLQQSECEENHDIMKKLRKLKQSLNRAFESPEFLPESKKDFLSTIEKEQFRFEENSLVTEGAFKSSVSNPDYVMLTDAFGFTNTLERIGEIFGIEFVEQASEVTLDIEALEMPVHLMNSNESVHLENLHLNSTLA